MQASELQRRLEAASESPELNHHTRAHARMLATEMVEDIIDHGGDFEIEDIENYLDDLSPPPNTVDYTTIFGESFWT